MAVDELTPPTDSSGIDNASYAELLREATELPSLTRENFTDQALDIFTTIQEARQQGQPLREGYRRASETYVTGAEDPRLGMQADIILSAPLACESSKRNQVLKEKLQHSELTPEERTEERARARVACEYNRRLRELIVDNPDCFTRADLQSWLEKGSGGNSGWAEKIISGVAAEAALMKLIETIPNLGVDPGTVDDDLRGIDFILIKADGRRVPVDVKYGEQRTAYYDEGRRAILPLETEELSGLSIKPELAEAVRRRVLSV